MRARRSESKGARRGRPVLNTGYDPQTAAAAQRSQDLAQALAAMRDPAQDIRTPVDPVIDRLAEALMQRRYGPSMQGLVQTTQPALSGLELPSGGHPAAFTPAITPDRFWQSSEGAVADPTFDNPIPAQWAGAPSHGEPTFDDLVPSQPVGAPHNGEPTFDDLIPPQWTDVPHHGD